MNRRQGIPYSSSWVRVGLICLLLCVLGCDVSESLGSLAIGRVHPIPWSFTRDMRPSHIATGSMDRDVLPIADRLPRRCPDKLPDGRPSVRLLRSGLPSMDSSLISTPGLTGGGFNSIRLFMVAVFWTRRSSHIEKTGRNPFPTCAGDDRIPEDGHPQEYIVLLDKSYGIPSLGDAVAFSVSTRSTHS